MILISNVNITFQPELSKLTYDIHNA